MTVRPMISLACLALPLFSSCDNDDNVVGVDREPPPIPAGVYSITGDESVEVRWSPLIGADVAGYTIYDSFQADGVYEEIGTVYGEASDVYIDSGVQNGVTRYYAVDAFDFAGNRSDLSSELVHDTPRPAGSGLTLYTADRRFSEAAVDWSEFAGGNGALAVAFDDALADFYIQEGADNRLYIVPTAIMDGGTEYMNDIQDFGFTVSLDDLDWAPGPFDGWSVNPDGLELVAGHSYVVWTWDDYYAKFRVSGIGNDSVTLAWAYQATDDFDFRFELAPGRKGEAR